MDINPYQVAAYFNVYIMKLVFFRYRVINFVENKDGELRKIHETLKLKKLEISTKFPHNILYTKNKNILIYLSWHKFLTS